MMRQNGTWELLSFGKERRAPAQRMPSNACSLNSRTYAPKDHVAALATIFLCRQPSFFFRLAASILMQAQSRQ